RTSSGSVVTAAPYWRADSERGLQGGPPTQPPTPQDRPSNATSTDASNQRQRADSERGSQSRHQPDHTHHKSGPWNATSTEASNQRQRASLAGPPPTPTTPQGRPEECNEREGEAGARARGRASNQSTATRRAASRVRPAGGGNLATGRYEESPCERCCGTARPVATSASSRPPHAWTTGTTARSWPAWRAGRPWSSAWCCRTNPG